MTEVLEPSLLKLNRPGEPLLYLYTGEANEFCVEWKETLFINSWKVNPVSVSTISLSPPPSAAVETLVIKKKKLFLGKGAEKELLKVSLNCSGIH